MTVDVTWGFRLFMGLWTLAVLLVGISIGYREARREKNP